MTYTRESIPDLEISCLLGYEEPSSFYRPFPATRSTS